MGGPKWLPLDFLGSNIKPERTILDAAGFDILTLNQRVTGSSPVRPTRIYPNQYQKFDLSLFILNEESRSPAQDSGFFINLPTET